jgi:hypothetical protein
MKLLGIVLSLGLVLQAAVVTAKPFKRVLVISGGGVNPGAALGMIAGVMEKGWRPDLIIATCGAGLGTAIFNSEPNIRDSYDVLTSWNFYKGLNEVVVQNPNGIAMMEKLKLAKNTFVYPDIFEGTLLHAPLDLPYMLRNMEFNRDPAKPKLVIVSARAFFGPHQVGQRRSYEPMFQQVYFTDPETAQHIDGWTLPKAKSYPFTTLMPQTLTVSNHSAVTAMRAGIADPFLLNPSVVDGYYHFTGAVDLFPLDLATTLGDEVLATYPASLFLDYEDTAVKAGFGFKQTTRALEAIQHKDVKWIDISGADDLSFNPKLVVVVMKSGIPSDYTQFKLGVAKQWNFGRDRANEAINVAPGKLTNVRYHLRKPINPKLYEDFTCKNANEWKTDQRDSCLSDRTSGCDRNKAQKCVAIR